MYFEFKCLNKYRYLRARKIPLIIPGTGTATTSTPSSIIICNYYYINICKDGTKFQIEVSFIFGTKIITIEKKHKKSHQTLIFFNFQLFFFFSTCKFATESNRIESCRITKCILSRNVFVLYNFKRLQLRVFFFIFTHTHDVHCNHIQIIIAKYTLEISNCPILNKYSIWNVIYFNIRSTSTVWKYFNMSLRCAKSI